MSHIRKNIACEKNLTLNYNLEEGQIRGHPRFACCVSVLLGNTWYYEVWFEDLTASSVKVKAFWYITSWLLAIFYWPFFQQIIILGIPYRWRKESPLKVRK